MQNSVTLKAPAKLNLYLHVGPVKNNGRHDLSSYVAFCADIFDEIILTPSKVDTDSLSISGGVHHTLPGDSSNLILRALDRIRNRTPLPYFDINLTKQIPIQAGLGGGSADAGAIYRWAIAEMGLDRTWAMQDSANLGGDVPSCVQSTAAIMAGEGERISPARLDRSVFALVVNPRLPCPTGEIFEKFDLDNPNGQDITTDFSNLDEIMLNARNDLTQAAIQHQPEIANCLEALKSLDGTHYARLSGSGASCFSLFDSYPIAELAKTHYQAARPYDWCHITSLD